MLFRHRRVFEQRVLAEHDAAIELLATFVDRAPPPMVKYLRLDTDLDPLRDDPRFEALVAAAETRVASASPVAAA